jgi:glycosyltransferase involved in cell wall biosynthesis
MNSNTSGPRRQVVSERRPETPALTVVLPTRDRRERLAETLAALAEQRGVEGGFEVVVVDDGSGDDTRELLASPPAGLALRWRSQERRGPAAARNRGIALARASRVLLLGDDTRPAPGALAEHLRSAGSRDLAVQGLIDWDPTAAVTPVMRFLAPAGPQFYFKGLTPGGPVPYTAVLGSNLSAPTAWFRDEPFDESFPDAAFEDTELAWRWQRRGRRTVYAPEALCWHRHHYADLEPFLARQERAGRAVRRALRRHPGMAGRVVAQPLAFGFYRLLRHGLRRAAGSGRREDGWDLACRRAFVRGLLGF